MGVDMSIKNNSTCLKTDLLERAAQEVIGELEMAALLLTQAPDVEVIRSHGWTALPI